MPGYERKSMQILGGGWNPLPPPDKVPITDYLLAQNFRSDALGRLVSRQGYPQVFDITGAGIAHSAANMGGVGDPYYVAANSALVSPTSALYYDGASIATGFDGRRVAFCAQNGAMWTMNRGNRGRHDPVAGWMPYGLTPPLASPVAAGAATPSFVGTVTYTFALQGAGYSHYLTINGVTYTWVEQSTDTAQNIAFVLVTIAGLDPNCSITCDGLGPNLVITPLVAGVLISVMGSDSNPDTVLGIGPIGALPTGSYTYYLTFQSADGTLESNPSPGSNVPALVASQAITVTIPTDAGQDGATDTRVATGGFINIYRTGGTLGAAYRVAQIPAPAVGSGGSNVTYTDSASDLAITNTGLVMPTENDPPPAAAGMIGPYFSRLYAWSTATNVNRLFWTPANQPQYWPGSGDNQVGNWVDVGLDGEAIIWCTQHANVLVIYKERSIWMLIGSDPGTATLEQVYDGGGLAGQWALTPAGAIDYFVGPNGLNLFDLTSVHVLSGDIVALFNQSATNAGPLTPPGSILPGTSFNSLSLDSYAVALGHAMGRLYIAYAELGTGAYNLLVFDEGTEPERNAYLAQQRAGRWFYERNAIAGTYSGFFGFFFDGTAMIGLTGVDSPGDAQGYNVHDFRGFLAEDSGPVGIDCVYGSHYENCGLPDNDKVWIEAVIDYELNDADSMGVYVGANAGGTALTFVQSLTGPGRQSVQVPLAFVGGAIAARTTASQADVVARNLAIALYVAGATGQVVIHNVFLYYYALPRLANAAATLPTDLGVGKIKECKELELDIDASAATVGVAISSDLPGNALAVRQTPTVAMAGRSVRKYPFAVAQGLLWGLRLTGGPFRLYGARLLMRAIGVYVEGYESTAGFKWDSMQLSLSDGEASSIDELRFECETYGATTVQLFTDLPGLGYASIGTYTLTAGAQTRAWVALQLADLVEGRGVQVQVTGNTGYRIYRAQVRHGRIGRFLAGATPSTINDAFNTLEFDFRSERRQMFKRIEISMRAAGTVTAAIITDQDGGAAPATAETLSFAGTGHQALVSPLPPGVRGRLLRIKLSSPVQARIYALRVWCREVSDSNAVWAWKDFPLEGSDIVPTWTDLISVEETSPVWQWVDLDVSVAESA